MNNLIINGKVIGHCSRPRAKGDYKADVFLMEDGYFITIDKLNIKNLSIDCKNAYGDTEYRYELYKS